LFIRVLYQYREQSKYLLHTFVVMPDHFHLLITLGTDVSVERAVQFVKGGFAFRAGKELSLHSPIWQKGFSENRIFTLQAFVAAREYAHQNPVKRGLVAFSTDYPYSSAGDRFVVDSPPQRLKPLVKDVASGIAKAMP
jgi:putative transposase